MTQAQAHPGRGWTVAGHGIPKSASALLLVMMAGVGSACGRSPGGPPAGIEPVYNRDSGELTLLRRDANRNGIAETQSHMRGTQIVRIDVDADEDGRVERWEYYGGDQRLQKVGFSRAGDGREDAWSFADATGAVVRIELAAPGSNRVTRIEHYENAQIVRAEEDGDADGAIDRWESYDRGRLVRLAFDESRAGAPTTALAYQADGSVQVETLKADLDRRR